MLSYSEFRTTVQAAVPGLQANWLNQEQDQAVAAPPHPPTFIVAGPGAGKTTVLVLRALKLMLVDQVPPEGIVATTFTRKAAGELRSRILSRGYAVLDMAIQLASDQDCLTWLQNIDVNQIKTGTLDSLSEQFLSDCRQPGEIVPTTIEGFLSKSLLRRHAFFTNGRHNDPVLEGLLLDLGLVSNYSNSFGKRLGAVMGVADRIRHDLIARHTYFGQGGGYQVLGDTIADYLQYLEDHHLADFGRLEGLVLERLQQNRLGPVVQPMQALLIDEFQDTNYLQEQIYLELARQSNASLTVVGDDDQSIYRFRGATVELFANFSQRIIAALGPEWQPGRVNLFRNYRSTSRIVEFCQHFVTADDGYQAARAPGKVALVAHAPHAASAQRNVPILGMFRNTAQELAQDLTEFLWDVFRGQGRQISCADGTYTIAAAYGGDFGDAVYLGHKVSELQKSKDKVRDRLPLLLRQELQARDINVFNPRGRNLGDMLVVRRLLGLALECIDPSASVLAAIPSMSQSTRAELMAWRQAGQVYCATNPVPGGLGQFVQDWRNRQLGPGSGMSKWPKEWPLLELIFTLTTWFPELQREPEGQVYLEAITRTINEVGQLSSSGYGARILHGQGVHDERAIRDAIRSVFEQIATEAVEVDEDVMPYVPRNYFPLMTIHQAKGLEFPLVIVDAGSDFTGNWPAQRRMRCPEGGDSTHTLESDVAAHCAVGPLRTVRTDLDRAWDDLRRLYFVGYSRPENVLLLAGLNKVIQVSKPVRCIATGAVSGGGQCLDFVPAEQWATTSPAGTVALI